MLLFLVASGVAAAVRADDLLITEFQAVNETTILDEDGEYTDWIEIYNAGAEPVNLAGWFLTDDPADLAKWTFPETNLAPGRFLLVFASEKDRSRPGRELHANFRLDPDGEFLALVRPDKVTLASQFAPKYILQAAGVSYGVPMESAASALVPSGAPAKTFIPADASLAETWTDALFDDAAWIAGETGIGFDKKTTPTYNDLIKTNVEAQMFKINATAYVRIPFEVADLAALGAVLLKMKYEDGFVAYLNGTEVARRNVPAVLTWNSRAPARRLEKDAALFEVFNLAPSLPLLRAGTNVLAIHGLNDSSTSATSDFLVLPEVESLKVTSVQTGTFRFFDAPTPGLPNPSQGFSAVAPAPEFSLPSGTYANAISVELRSSPQAVIHYTIDRTEPTEASPVYAAPLAIENTTMVRARIFESGILPGPIVSSTYVMLAANVKDASSNLPIMVVEMFGRSITEDPLSLAFVTFHENPAGRTAIADAPFLASRAGIKKRGSSSLGFPKNNFALEIWDEKNRDRDVEILDMARESDWILHGPYSDKTLMRNYLTYDWSNQFGRWAVRCRFVELYLNQAGTKVDANDYWGVYVFMEKIKRGDQRLDLKKLHASETSAPEITGGYILKNDRLDPGDSGLLTRRGLRLAYVYPKEKEGTAAQKAYIKGFLDELETALYGADFKNPDTGYAKYIDVGSFIDQHILVELTKNIDGYRLSAFMFKDREGKLNMGPAWDYNLSLGNADYLDGWNPVGWYYPLLGNPAQEYPWYPRLFQDPAFLEKYKERWIALRGDVVKTGKLLQQIDDLASYLDEAQQRNFLKWRTLGTYVWPNKFIGRTYAEEIGFMKGWLRDRIAWMDSTFVSPPVFSKAGGAVEPGFQLTITAPAGDIYYTLNGGDPRSADEAPSADSLAYNPADGITITANTRVRVRVKVGFIWSILKEATFITQVPPLVIAEIMYNPAPPPEGSTYRAVDFEFIEVQNVGDQPFDLKGVRFTKGITFDFTGSAVESLAPGELAVVVKKRVAFETRYDTTGMMIAGEYTLDLSDTRESVAIKGALDEIITDFAYQDAWYPETDGQGRSLVLVDPHGPRDAFGVKETWRASGELNGSPGKEDVAPAGGLQRPGDVSQDGQLNLTDAISLLRYLFQGLLAALPCEGGTPQDPASRMLSDADGDGSVNLTDAVAILRYLFQEGTPPALGVSCVRVAGCPDVCVE